MAPEFSLAPTSFICPAAHRPGIIEVIEEDARPVTDAIFTIQTENKRAGTPLLEQSQAPAVAN